MVYICTIITSINVHLSPEIQDIVLIILIFQHIIYRMSLKLLRFFSTNAKAKNCK